MLRTIISMTGKALQLWRGFMKSMAANIMQNPMVNTLVTQLRPWIIDEPQYKKSPSDVDPRDLPKVKEDHQDTSYFSVVNENLDNLFAMAQEGKYWIASFT